MEIDDQKKKSVNNYRQLATIILEWSSIINNYQQFFFFLGQPYSEADRALQG